MCRTVGQLYSLGHFPSPSSFLHLPGVLPFWTPSSSVLLFLVVAKHFNLALFQHVNSVTKRKRKILVVFHGWASMVPPPALTPQLVCVWLTGVCCGVGYFCSYSIFMFLFFFSPKHHAHFCCLPAFILHTSYHSRLPTSAPYSLPIPLLLRGLSSFPFSTLSLCLSLSLYHSV